MSVFERYLTHWVALAMLAGIGIVAFLLGVTDIVVPCETLVLSVVLFVALPLAAGLWTRRMRGSADRIAAFRERVKPWGVVGLIATVTILFGLQGQVIVED